MDNIILNEITSIKKMMGLITEATEFSKFDGGYGIEKNNFDTFITVAQKAKETPFFFGNHIFKLESYGENNDSKNIAPGIHNLRWYVGKPTYSNPGGYPHIAAAGNYDARITTRKGGRGLEFTASPQNVNFDSPEFENSKEAFVVFKHNLKQLTSDSRQKVLDMYGEKLKEKFGEESVNTL